MSYTKTGRDGDYVAVLRESDNKSPDLWSWQLLVGRRVANSRGVTEGGTNTSFAHLALSVLAEQETFAIVHPGRVVC